MSESPANRAARLAAERAALIRRDGPWTAHNIELADGLYTIGARPDGQRTRRFLQVISDIAGPDLSRLRVLDLACLEGLYAIELALHGAEAVGIEVRSESLAKAQFAQEALGLERLSFHQDDVRDLSVERYGTFDVVICSGIFYHLDAPDVFELMRSIAACCTRLLVLDTQVSVAPVEERVWEGRAYRGRLYREHADASSEDERRRRLWQSIDNTFSFWLTEPSLLDLLQDVGFSSAFRCLNPPALSGFFDRRTYAAVRGERLAPRTNPLLPADPRERWPRRPPRRVSPFQLPGYRLWEATRDALPAPLRRRLKSALGIGTPPEADPAEE